LIADRMIQNTYNLNDGISCIATGLNYFPTYIEDVLSFECEPKYELDKTKENISGMIGHLEVQKQEWNNAIRDEKSLYQYLKENIYNDS